MQTTNDTNTPKYFEEYFQKETQEILTGNNERLKWEIKIILEDNSCTLPVRRSPMIAEDQTEEIQT